MRRRQVLVVIYVWRPFVLGWGIFLEQFEHDLDSLFELRVVALAHQFRVHLDLVVGRDAVVFDFRPRPGFKSSNRQEDLISKLIGVVWIDPVDKQVMRLEARLAEGFKMAGGLLVNLRPGAAFVMEQKRMLEGIWLPRMAQINLSVKVLLFGGGDYNHTIEWSDYKHFSGDVGGYKLDAPKIEPPDKKP